MARNGSGMNVRAGVSTLGIRRHIREFAGQAQSGTVAAMVKFNTISMV
jgi:hypothetical protein